jgi:hypothetical protein
MEKEILQLMQKKDITIEEALQALADCKSLILNSIPCTAYLHDKVSVVTLKEYEPN